MRSYRKNIAGHSDVDPIKYLYGTAFFRIFVLCYAGMSAYCDTTVRPSLIKEVDRW